MEEKTRFAGDLSLTCTDTAGFGPSLSDLESTGRGVLVECERGFKAAILDLGHTVELEWHFDVGSAWNDVLYERKNYQDRTP